MIDVIEEMYHIIYAGYMSDVFGGYKMFGYSILYYAEFLEYDN